MDNKQKQIAEMAKDIYTTGVAIDGTDIAYGVFDNDDHFHTPTKHVLNCSL